MKLLSKLLTLMLLMGLWSSTYSSVYAQDDPDKEDEKQEESKKSDDSQDDEDKSLYDEESYPEEVKNFRLPVESLVLIEGDVARGSGFVAKIRDICFLVTNIHVLAPNSSISLSTAAGEQIHPQGQVFLSKDRDLAIIRIEPTEHYLEVTEDIITDIKIGSWVVVPGNSKGAGVITQLVGKVKGIGPNLLEVDARFVKGNSGCPIIDPVTGKVLGLASYVKAPDNESKIDQDSTFTKFRRFAYRIDNNEEWEAATIQELNKENEILEKFIARTQALAYISYALNKKRTVLSGYQSDPSLKHVFDPFMENFNFDYKNTRGNVTAMQRFVNGLDREITRDVPTTRNSLKHQWFIKQMEDYLPLRDFAADHLHAVDYTF